MGDGVAGADGAGLGLVARLLATATRQGSGVDGRDRLAAPSTARDWLASVATAPGGAALADIALTGRDLVPLRRLRESLRDVLAAGPGGPGGSATVEPVASVVALRWDGATVTALPRGAGWRRVAAAVSVELLLADAAGALGRLRTCAHEPYGYPFLDDSRNRSRRWHDAAACGNRVNLRASRARRAAVGRSARVS
jgi:CGNR zinc finger